MISSSRTIDSAMGENCLCVHFFQERILQKKSELILVFHLRYFHPLALPSDISNMCDAHLMSQFEGTLLRALDIFSMSPINLHLASQVHD